MARVEVAQQRRIGKALRTIDRPHKIHVAQGFEHQVGCRLSKDVQRQIARRPVFIHLNADAHFSKSDRGVQRERVQQVVDPKWHRVAGAGGCAKLNDGLQRLLQIAAERIRLHSAGGRGGKVEVSPCRPDALRPTAPSFQGRGCNIG